MSLFFPKFFEGNDYFIDEKVQFLKFHNEYKVFDASGFQIGIVRQRVSGWHKVLRMLINKKMMPFTLEIIDLDGNVAAGIYRGWTFFLSKIEVRDGSGTPLGYLKQKFSILKPRFHIFDTSGNKISEISGDWKAWNFKIADASGNQIGTITKKWAGLAKELFTTADKYNVNIVPEFAEDRNKINIVATAITIDMVLKESK